MAATDLGHLFDALDEPVVESSLSIPEPAGIASRASTAEIERILSSIPTLPEQIDAFAEARGWFRPDEDSNSYSAVQAYLKDEISLEDSVAQIATPIEEAWTTADGTRKVAQSAEGCLWDLWYSVLHSAKKIPWYDEAAQGKLLDLVKALKARPNPPKTVKVSNDWVLGSDTLWSTTLLLGPSIRESWNDAPYGQSGFQIPEQRAWTNVNAFAARLRRDGVFPVYYYPIWALRDALEDRHPENEKYRLDATVPAAAAWVFILRRSLYDWEKDLKPESKNQGDPACPGELWRRKGGRSWAEKKRWAFWKERFGEVSRDEGVREETRKLSAKTVGFMEGIEKGE